MIRIWQTFGKHFLPQAGCGNISSAKSCGDAWISSSCLAKGQMNMAVEAKPCSPILSTFEVLVVWCVVGHCHGELGPLCWSAAGLQFSVHLIDLWAYFSDEITLLGLRKLSWIISAADHQIVTHDLFCCKFGFGKCFGTSRSSQWTRHCRLSYAVHCSLHVIIKRWFVVAYSKKRQHFKTMNFFFDL